MSEETSKSVCGVCGSDEYPERIVITRFGPAHRECLDEQDEDHNEDDEEYKEFYKEIYGE